MKITKKKFTTVIALTLAAAFLFAGCGDAAKLTEYDFGTDKIPTVNFVIDEERKVTGISTGFDNGVQYKQYTYKSDSVFDDLLTYSEYLRGSGWLVIQDYDLNDSEGELQLATDSSEAGKILIISVAFTSGEYAVRINKLEGELTDKEDK